MDSGVSSQKSHSLHFKHADLQFPLFFNSEADEAYKRLKSTYLTTFRSNKTAYRIAILDSKMKQLSKCLGRHIKMLLQCIFQRLVLWLTEVHVS